MKNLEIWNAVCRPPKEALKTIGAGRLKGKSDINPQWRYKAMTEQFGPCGVGWKFEIIKLWAEQGSQDQVFAFAQVNLFLKHDGGWSEPIPGVGGHFMIVKETSGLHANDECYKMAITDAIGTAMKMVGVAADIYAGLWDGSKYIRDSSATKDQVKSSNPETRTAEQANKIMSLGEERGLSKKETADVLKWFFKGRVLTKDEADFVINGNFDQIVANYAEREHLTITEKAA